MCVIFVYIETLTNKENHFRQCIKCDKYRKNNSGYSVKNVFYFVITQWPNLIQ